MLEDSMTSHENALLQFFVEWLSIYIKNLNWLQNLQNRAAHLIYCKPKYTHTTPLLKKIYWLHILSYCIEFKSLVTYEYFYSQAPNCRSDLFTRRQSTYNTRSSSHTRLYIPWTYLCRGPCILLLLLNYGKACLLISCHHLHWITLRNS